MPSNIQKNTTHDDIMYFFGRRFTACRRIMFINIHHIIRHDVFFLWTISYSKNSTQKIVICRIRNKYIVRLTYFEQS